MWRTRPALADSGANALCGGGLKVHEPLPMVFRLVCYGQLAAVVEVANCREQDGASKRISVLEV
jgi:hypothetical protein